MQNNNVEWMLHENDIKINKSDTNFNDINVTE